MLHLRSIGTCSLLYIRGPKQGSCDKANVKNGFVTLVMANKQRSSCVMIFTYAKQRRRTAKLRS